MFAIASQAQTREEDEDTACSTTLKILEYFPGAVAIADNDGNLPLHTAASVLRGRERVDVVYILLDEAERQLRDPSGARFRNKIRVPLEDDVSLGGETVGTAGTVDFDDVLHCCLVKNDSGDVPLMTAIRSRAGFYMIEALCTGRSGPESVMCQDTKLNNCLHLLVDEGYTEPSAIMSLLKVAPQAACVRNADNLLPIEIACMGELPREVILALVLVDLPFELHDTDCERRDVGFGSSWVFLTCECDDHYVDIVEEVMSLCSYPQARELCFFDDGIGDSVLARATPKCRGVLQRSLRFVGRYEFIGSVPSTSQEQPPSFRMFDAFDYGTRQEPLIDGRRVLLKCYLSRAAFDKEVRSACMIFLRTCSSLIISTCCRLSF